LLRVQQLLEDKLVTMLNGYAEGKGIKENQVWHLTEKKDGIVFVEKEKQATDSEQVETISA
jgi:hypothetical protein